MLVYVDPRLIGKHRFNDLVKKYPKIEFITEIERIDQIEILITMPKIVKEMTLDEYSSLKWVQYLMAGYDGVDLKAFREKGIVFSNAQDIFSKSIAEDVFTKIFVFNRHVPYYLDEMAKGTWNPIREEPELTGSTVLILGTGSIGKELAKRFKAFEMKVIGYRSKPIPEDNFDEIIVGEEALLSTLPKADYVILALPLNDQTHHMFDQVKISKMKSSALLINVARGQVVKQDDLYKALKSKSIRGAGLDVTEPEPLPRDHPLWQLDNVYITPHNASSSPYMRERLYQMICMNLDLYLADQEVRYIIN